MKWTPEQFQAISLRGKNILVSAAAGSGKTAVLVERIIGLILEENVSLSQLLVVTFSNAAASEMKEKIISAVSKKIEEPGLDEELQQFLRVQLDTVHKANISTFHAFSMEVIRRYFHLINEEPNFRICDEAQKTILQGEALEELFEEMFRTESQDFLHFLKKFAGSKNENAAKEMILYTHGFIQSMPDPFQWLREQVEKLSYDEEAFAESSCGMELKKVIRRELSLGLSYFEAVDRMVNDQGLEALALKSRKDILMVEEALEALEREGSQQALTLIQAGKFQTFTAVKAEKEAFEEIKEDVKFLRERGKRAVNKVAETFGARSLSEYVADIRATSEDGRILCDLTEAFDKKYREKKRKRSLLDFSDIEHLALEILSFEEACREYREKFRYIFIDEYQDSNIVQETLISRIKGSNNVFMVGDVKQSIYKFRLAEPELFIQKYESFKSGLSQEDAKIDLNRNFRSKGNIIKGINQVFSQIMRKETTGLDYDEAAALYKGTEYDGDLDYPVSIHIVDDKQVDDMVVDDEIKEMKKAQLEAYTAVKLIKNALGKKVFDGKRGKEKAISYKDMVILLRAVKGYGDIYYETLMDAGVPVYIDNSDGYFDTVEIQVFLNLLKVIDNKRQDIPLLSVLRSPIFGFDLDEMAAVRVEQKQGSYFDAFQAYAEYGFEPELKEKCGFVLEQLTLWSERAAYTPLEDLLWSLIRETGYYEYVGAIPGGAQRQANLRALVDKAVAYQSSYMKGLFGFINYIEAMQKEKVATGQVRLTGENDDVVRIMSVHKSKGLEFPYVLVGGLGKKFRFSQEVSKAHFHKDIGVGLRYVDLETKSYKKTLVQSLIEQRKKEEDMAEEIRILYVAFTRAMDELVLLGTLTDREESMKRYQMLSGAFTTGARSYLDMVIPVIPQTDIEITFHDRGGISVEKQEEEAGREDVKKAVREGFAPAAGEEAAAWRQVLKQEIARRMEYRYPYVTANQMKSKYSVSELSKLKGQGGQAFSIRREYDMPSEITPQFMLEKKALSAAERGTALHKVMEHLPFDRFKGGVDYGQVDGFIKTLVEREILTAEEAETVNRKRIIRFFTSEIGKRAARAEQVYKEVSFNLEQELSGETIIIQGTIDCYFKEGDHYVLLDYKSDYAVEEDEVLEELKERHRPQLQLYKKALEEIRGIKVGQVCLYLFSLGRALEMD